MEKQAANSKPTRNKILKLLPKAAGAVVSYQNLPFSPNRDKRSSDYNHPNKQLPPRAPPHHHHHHHYHFSGPMIPEEARKKSKNDQTIDQEPTSPKVSCMGQIKQRHKEKEKKKKIKKATIINNKKSLSLPKDIKPSSSSSLSSPGHELKKHASKIRRIFTISKHSRSKSNVYASDDDHDDHENNNIESPVQLPDRAPGLSQMRRFASGHSVLADFDWTAQITPVDSDHRNYFSDEERENSDEEEHEEVIIPFSAPMMIGGGVDLQPRNEINLWKRRTMNPPRPLQLNPTIKAKA
ncbi:hypothetical protein Dsin_003791 [Dipteronia sinensis]|uniref:Syringolide-induced protein 14-1-1 n=1 Tax=Dipteronia sinensis TaxID=43782 RepID=A0AAE0EMH1_9ROSI|nr:hypothetical protein Dsin_003791 [Dipteronia sinensis]